MSLNTVICMSIIITAFLPKQKALNILDRKCDKPIVGGFGNGIDNKLPAGTMLNNKHGSRRKLDTKG